MSMEQYWPSQVVKVYLALDAAIQGGKLIFRAERRDKEFHFQDWFKARLSEIGIYYEVAGRNSYPDFRLVHFPEGFELKGLAYPGREATYDCNSQIPRGWHNGRTVYYVFGRYPKYPDGDEYPVIDLVVCHGDLLNADHDYAHKNRSIKAFGSYGDIMIRDRKMYVAPTPFALLEGTAGRRTLVLPSSMQTEDDRLRPVGRFSRVEAEKLLVAYKFDLINNQLIPRFEGNPNAGTKHEFVAYRSAKDGEGTVELRAAK